MEAPHTVSFGLCCLLQFTNCNYMYSEWMKLETVSALFPLWFTLVLMSDLYTESEKKPKLSSTMNGQPETATVMASKSL